MITFANYINTLSGKEDCEKLKFLICEQIRLIDILANLSKSPKSNTTKLLIHPNQVPGLPEFVGACYMYGGSLQDIMDLLFDLDFISLIGTACCLDKVEVYRFYGDVRDDVIYSMESLETML